MFGELKARFVKNKIEMENDSRRVKDFEIHIMGHLCLVLLEKKTFDFG